MIISFTHDVHFKNSVPNIIIEGNPVEVVDHAKLLGVILSDDLTWNMHVDSIVKKAAKRVYMLYQLKRAGISQSDLVTVYLSVVIEMECVSHKEAWTKSFRVLVTADDPVCTLDCDFWPLGIGCRRFFKKRQRTDQ